MELILFCISRPRRVPKRARNHTVSQHLNRLAKEAAAKRTKIANETEEQRRVRLLQKREINKKLVRKIALSIFQLTNQYPFSHRYFNRESAERREIRLRKKAERDRRNKLDMQLQQFHPDLLAKAGIDIVRHDSGTVELRVPWAVPSNETEEQQKARYDHQEKVIKRLKEMETPDQVFYRRTQTGRPTSARSLAPRTETEEARARRLERAKMWTRNRRNNETPEERVRRLQEQRLRTQRNRERKSNETMIPDTRYQMVRDSDVVVVYDYGLDEAEYIEEKIEDEEEGVIWEGEEVVSEEVVVEEEIVDPNEPMYEYCEVSMDDV